MADYDVIVIGGGMSGLCCAAYLGRAGLKTLLLEARGQCGAHCDTTEPGIPGFLHNLHTTWMITAISPAMADLELDRFGLEFVTSDVVYGKTFRDGKNALLGLSPMDTAQFWQKHSARDAAVILAAAEHFIPRLAEVTSLLHDYVFTAPCWENEARLAELMNGFYEKIGLGHTFEQVRRMNGFQALDILFESEHVKTLMQSLSWIAGLPPIHKKVGALGTALLAPLTGPLFPVHLVKGGSHAATHALVKAATAYGVKILPSCPVEKILVEDGQARGAVLAEHAVYGGETFTADTVVSNVTVAPTFLEMIGAEHISPEMAHRISQFSYDEQNLFAVYYALSDAPRFASASFDEGIERCFMGYFGGENTEEMEAYGASLLGGRIHKEVIANWFIPSLADPSQAPPGCHTSFVWFDVPPEPVRWRDERLEGFTAWDRIKERLADEVTDTYERYAPGFKKTILDRHILSPLDMYRNNPSAVLGNWVGGSVTPDQHSWRRPVPGVCVGGASRTFLKNLYLSNSIYPFGVSWMASGYIAACEVAQDRGVREQPWWKAQAFEWLFNNMGNIPSTIPGR